MPTKKNNNTDAPRILIMEAGFGSGARAVVRAGGVPLCISPRNVEAVDEALALNRFDGLLLMGGGDVDPRLYGEKPHKQVYGVSEVRDYTEWTALEHAREHGLPVLGICRGMQLMTVHNGGALRQHVGGHRGIDHLVFGESGSRFRRVIGGERGMFVSLHHQVVKRTGNGWRVGARDSKGLIEAVESRDGRCLGVQFHPEMDATRNECSRRIFNWLVDEAARRASKPKPKRQRAPRHKPLAPARPQQLSFAERLTALDAGTKVKRAKPVQRGVAVTWVCRDCGLRFDKQQDRDDHEYWVCGDPQMRVTEPPPGHPDWM